jgi:hypothetical protein
MSSTYKGQALGAGILVIGSAIFVNRYHRSKVNVPSTFSKDIVNFEKAHVFNNTRYNDDQMFHDYSKDTAHWPKWDRRDDPNEIIDQEELTEKCKQHQEAIKGLPKQSAGLYNELMKKALTRAQSH